LKSLKCVKTLRGHTDSINSIKVIAAQNKLISGSNDSTIKIWDLSSSSPNEFKLLRNIKEHNGAVNCLEILSTDEFISGSSDNTIRIWNVNTAKCKTTLQDVSAIWSLKLINGNLLVSGNQNIYKNIRLWDLDKKYELDEIKGHSKYVIGFEVMSNGNLVSCSGDKSIKIWQL
jgi:WD40 repeat protein